MKKILVTIVLCITFFTTNAQQLKLTDDIKNTIFETCLHKLQNDVNDPSSIKFSDNIDIFYAGPIEKSYKKFKTYWELHKLANHYNATVSKSGIDALNSWTNATIDIFTNYDVYFTTLTFYSKNIYGSYIKHSIDLVICVKHQSYIKDGSIKHYCTIENGYIDELIDFDTLLNGESIIVPNTYRMVN